MSLNTFMPVMTSPKTMPRYSRMGLPSMELVVVTIILTSSVCHWIRLCRAYSISMLAALSSPQLVQAANGADIHELRRVRAHVLAEQARGGEGRVKARDAQDAAADGLAVQLDVVAHRVVVQGAGVDDEADASALQQPPRSAVRLTAPMSKA